MARSRKCSEYAHCGKLLVGKSAQAKTCSTACRSRRAHRLKRARSKGGQMSPYDPALAAVVDVAAGKTKEAAHDVLKEELRPIVREALTQDVLDGLGELVEMVPEAVALIRADFDSADETIRQRAYTLLLKYTLGNQSIAPASATAAPAPMQVFFGRQPDAPSTPAEAVELNTCEACGREAPKAEFVANSDRCRACHAEVQQRVAVKFPMKP